MADTKISALSGASALAGTEAIPVVQGGVTKSATPAQLIAYGGGKPTPTPDTVTSRMAHIAARTIWNTNLHASETQGAFKQWNYNYRAVTTLRIWFYNGYVNAGVETSSGGNATYTVAVEYPKGTFTATQQVTVAGNATGYVDVPVTIPAFAWYRIGGDIQMAGSGKVPYAVVTNVADTGNGDQAGFSANFGNAALGTYFNSGMAIAMGPVLIQAVHDLPVWVALGDSIGIGTNDVVQDGNGGHGMVGRAMASVGPNINVSIAGDSANRFMTGSNSTNRRAIINASDAKRGLLQLGSNDIYSEARTRTLLEASRLQIRNLFPTIGWLDMTLLPRTTSSDSFKTAANQSINATSNGSTTYEFARTDFNTRLRNGIAMTAGSVGTIDVAGLVETTTAIEVRPVLNGGVWMVGLADDGTHVNSYGNDTLTATISRALDRRR